MRIRIAPRVGGVPADRGGPQIPTSKSHAQRALCLGELLPVEVRYAGLPDGADVQALRAALARLARLAPGSGDGSGGSGGSPAGDGAFRGPPIALRDNGTALRILAVLPALLGLEVVLDAGPRLRQRPLDPAEEFLTAHGARCSPAGTWPRRFDGRGVDWPEELRVDARVTTQVATGVLLGAAIRSARIQDAGASAPGSGAAAGHRVWITAPAAPAYLEVTLQVLGWFGFPVAAAWTGGDLRVELGSWRRPGSPLRVEVPVDASSYAFYAAFLALHDLPPEAPPRGADPHPDWLVLDDLQRLGSAVPGEELHFAEVGSRPDGFPCLAALAALRRGRTRLTGAPALRHKESDRIAAMAAVLNALGARCTEHPDGLTVEAPIPARDAAAPVRVPTPDDHRIVMAAALLGSRLPGGVEIDHPDAVAKSWPGFFDWLGRVAEVGEV